jgi:hypothetical protein
MARVILVVILIQLIYEVKELITYLAYTYYFGNRVEMMRISHIG